jgi:DNA-binding LacI/PurR family transcriptional regulator
VTGIDDVARRAGVSTATVSRALSGRGVVAAGTAERVRRAAADLGYVVSAAASGLARGRSLAVAIVVASPPTWFTSTVVRGASVALAEAGYDALLVELPADERRPGAIARVSSVGRADAVLFVGIEASASEGERMLRGRPGASIGGRLDGADVVSADEESFGRLATEHLVGLGHRRIAHIGGVHEADPLHVPTRRRLGYERALADAGLPIDPALFRPGDFTVSGGRSAAASLLDLDDPPTAVVAASDELAVGALVAARDRGLDVPGGLSVVGIDDHPLAAEFGLSTVAQFPARRGERAARLLLARLAAPVDAGPGRDDAVLIPRSSSGAPSR